MTKLKFRILKETKFRNKTLPTVDSLFEYEHLRIPPCADISGWDISTNKLESKYGDFSLATEGNTNKPNIVVTNSRQYQRNAIPINSWQYHIESNHDETKCLSNHTSI